MDRIQRLQAAIRRLHGCASTHIESVPVEERFQGRLVWAGTVEVFALQGHPKATKCFAWCHGEGKNDERTRYVAVLCVPPVDSPQVAVRAAIVARQ
jgi:hypothetical protein